MRTFENNEINDEEYKISNNKQKPYKQKYCSLVVLFILVLLLLFIIALFIFQVIRINKLNNEIEDLKNSFNEDFPYLKNKTSYLSRLNDKVNKNEIDLLEKGKEIQLIKSNLQQKEKENDLINQKINNLNTLMNDNINNIKNDLNLKDEEIELLKKKSDNLNNSNLIINKNINSLENKLDQNNKEFEIYSSNINILNDKVNNIEIIANKNSDEIQDIKNIESNLSLLVDFKVKVRIKALFFIDDQQAQLCSHRPFYSDIIDDGVKLNVFKWGYGGCVWNLHQNGKFFEFTLTDSSYEMNNWKIEINNNNVFCTDKSFNSIFILENASLNKYYKIKNNQTGQYLFINKDNQRDDESYFIDLTTNKDEATDFRFEIYHEE